MPRAGLDREAVVMAAAELADSDPEGLDAVTLTALAERLGIRTPSLYAHIDGLADLRRHLRVRGARQLTAAIVTATSGRAGLDALRGLAGTYREFAHAHPGIYAAMQRAPEEQDVEAAAAARELVDAIITALSGYGLSGDDAIHAIRVVRATLHGFVSLEQLGGFRIPISLDETYDRLVAMLDRSLSGPEPSTSSGSGSPTRIA
ncbi:MAG TPA: WHG domain-containing protein [Solirubrobacteraceae bacterium]|jgi:AcrR family transcriptional regulator|nr:WHG domain-containing protein [Solirubrobacteraceae bacterium]